MSLADHETADRREAMGKSLACHGDACCAPHGAAADGSEASTKPDHAAAGTLDRFCPACGQPAQAVPLATVRRLVLLSRASLLHDGPYRFCTTPSCDVVYYDTTPGRLLMKDDLRVRVGLKETTDPITVCYCFEHTRSSIRDEILATGRSTFQERITAEVKAGRCACETENPSGRCSLGDVARTVREIRVELDRTPQLGRTENQGSTPCDCG